MCTKGNDTIRWSQYRRLPNVVRRVRNGRHLTAADHEDKTVSAVADASTRRAASGALCRRWTLSVNNWPSTVASIVNLVRLTTIQLTYYAEHAPLSI